MSDTENGVQHGSQLQQLVAKFRRKAFAIRTVEQQNEQKSTSGAELKRCLGGCDLVMLGVGGIVGAGVFVLTGVAARSFAGPGVIVSYALAGAAALVSALCYAEFAVELPMAGGAFNYVALTFGEYASWVVACDLILEYTLSAAAVAKGLTSYLAALLGLDISVLRLSAGHLLLDPAAGAAVALLSLVLARSTSGSSRLNMLVTAVNMAVIAFVLLAGLPRARAANFAPFAPFGLQGIFRGASVVFFSFIGFDTVATAAEEVRDPGRNLPLGIVGSLLLATGLYVLMAATIVGLQPYQTIDLDAPFAVAFQRVGMGWAQRLVAAGALAGIVTSLLVALLGQARIYVTLGRARLLPPWFARVHGASGTPVNATLVTALTSGALALLLDMQLLAELVSIGTLFVFMAVCAGVLFRRYHVPGEGRAPAPVLWRLLAVALASVAFSVSFTERAHPAMPALSLVAWLAASLSFYMLPVMHTPAGFRVPLAPLLPCAGVLATLHLIGSLGWPAYVRWLVWWLAGTCVYLGYGLHHSQQGGTQPAAGAAAGPSQRGMAPGGRPAHVQLAGASGPGAALAEAEPHSAAPPQQQQQQQQQQQRKQGPSEQLSLLPEGVTRSDAAPPPRRPGAARP